MTRPADDQGVRYLLGEMEEAEREAFEDVYFAHDDAFEELKAIEDDLLDAYTRGRLDPERRARFEERYVRTGNGRQRLEFAHALHELARSDRDTEPASPRRSAPRWTAWAAGLAAAALAALAFHVGQLRVDLRRLAANRDALQRSASDREQRLAGELEGLKARVTEMEGALGDVDLGRVVSLVLTPGSARDLAGIARLRLARSATRVRLVLRLPAPTDHDGYRVTLETPEGRRVVQVPATRIPGADGPAVVATLPAASLEHRHYMVGVEGVRQGRTEPLADYTFQVVRPD